MCFCGKYYLYINSLLVVVFPDSFFPLIDRFLVNAIYDFVNLHVSFHTLRIVGMHVAIFVGLVRIPRSYSLSLVHFPLLRQYSNKKVV